MAQNQDNDIRPVLGWLQALTKAPPNIDLSPCSLATRSYVQQWDALSLRGGVVYRSWDNTDGVRTGYQVVLPHSHRRSIIQTAHRSGHLGVERTSATVQRLAYWVGWQREVKMELARCNECAQYFRGKPPRQAGLQSQLSGTPWAKVAVDIIGKHPRSSRGYEYIFTVMDLFTK